jgi:hypothetical protein
MQMKIYCAYREGVNTISKREHETVNLQDEQWEDDQSDSRETILRLVQTVNILTRK